MREVKIKCFFFKGRIYKGGKNVEAHEVGNRITLCVYVLFLFFVIRRERGYKLRGVLIFS